MFSSTRVIESHNVVITGGQFNQVRTNVVININRGIDLSFTTSLILAED